jgi:methanogenic corrinoid protein MtbC1
MNLCNVWAYRNSQKRSLRKMQKKSAGVLDDEARVKVQENISRNERNLQQLDDNLREALGRVSLLCDLSKAGVSLDASSANAMSDVANALASSFKEPADKTEKAE